MVADVVVSSIKSFPDAASLALVSDLQFNEPYSSAALNRKFRGIVNPGFYGGFLPLPAGGLNLKISSGEEGGTASINIDKYYQMTVRQQADVTMSVTAGKKVIVVLEATYALGRETYQVNCKSAVQAAEIKLLEEGTALRQNQLELCTVTVPAGAPELTEEMIDISRRLNKTVGITLSSAIDSDADHIAASSHAVKKAVKAASDETKKQIKELVDGAPEELDTLAELAEALGNDPKFATTMLNKLTEKQPVDNTLTNLSGKDVADLLQYLGFGSFPQYQMLGAKQHIIQHGSGAANSSGIADIVFPKAFTTTSNLNVTATPTSQQPANYIVTVGTITTTGVRLYLTGANAGATPVTAAIGFHWKAEGK